MSHDDYLSRIRNFKNRGKDNEEMRRRRCEVSVVLRKARRDDQLQKRRNIVVPNDDAEEDNALIDCSPTRIVNPRDILHAIRTGDKGEILSAVQSARKILSRLKSPPISLMINAGLVPVLVELLGQNHGDDTVEIQFEAAWALTNIASGNSEQTKTVIDAGAVPKFITLLNSQYPTLVEQAVWALGNITGDGPEARDLVLRHGVMKSLLRLLDVPEVLSHESCLRNIVWTLSNLCRHKKPPPNFEIVKEAVPYLAALLQNQNDAEVLADSCWAFSYLTDGTNDKIQTVIDQNVVPRLVQLLGSSNAAVVAPALRVIGNIVTGNDEQTDIVLKAMALPRLKNLLRSEKSNLVKEAAWAISNVVAGTLAQIQKVIEADILPEIISVLGKGDFRAQREAAWVVTNFTSGCSVFQLFVFLNMNVIPYFLNLLSTVDMKTICVVLDGVWNMLQMCEKINEHANVCTAIEECGGLDKIEELQNHQSDQVYNKAYRIIDHYFAEARREGETPDSSINLGNSPLTYMTPDTTSFTF